MKKGLVVTMRMLQQGFTLIIVLTILMVLSLIVMATFEQAQWVKRSSYLVWQQVKMQDRVWQQLILAEEQLAKRAATSKCLVTHSLSNDYFFANKNPQVACIYKLNDQQIGVIYELIASIPCAQIKNSMNLGVNFFRVTIQSAILASGQKMVLQSIVALPEMGKKKTENLDEKMVCTENKQYQAGRQSWLLQ